MREAAGEEQLCSVVQRRTGCILNDRANLHLDGQPGSLTASTLLPAVVYSLTRRAKLQEGVRHVPGRSSAVFRQRVVDAAAPQATARRRNFCAGLTGGSEAGPPHGTAGVLLTSRMHTGLWRSRFSRDGKGVER